MPDDWTAKLDTYLDGELPVGEMKDLDAHLRNCPGCVADVLSRLQLRRTVQSAGRRYRPDSEFRQRVRLQITSRSRRPFWRGWLAAAAVVAGLFLAALGVTYFGRQRSERAQTFSELADLHVAALAGSNPVDVVSTDRHTVKPWFAGKIPFAFDLPELQNSEFSLVGGRVTYLGQEPGAELIYRFRKHEISVFIFQEGAAGQALPSDSGPQKRVSFTVETWSAGGLRYFVLGDAGAEDIAKLASLFKQAARP